MAQKYKIAILRVFAVIIAMYILSINIDKGLISFAFAMRFRPEFPPFPSRGLLSTGILYEFRGTFDFFEERQQYQFYWERAVFTGDSTIAYSPAQAVEIGQFYLFPGLEQGVRVGLPPGWLIIIRYCPRTDNWVMKWEFCEWETLARIGFTNYIFTINRTTGAIVQYGSNLEHKFSPVPVSDFRLWRQGWRRTIDNRTLLRRLY